MAARLFPISLMAALVFLAALARPAEATSILYGIVQGDFGTEEFDYALLYPVRGSRTFGCSKLRDTLRDLRSRGESRNGKNEEAVHRSSSAGDGAKRGAGTDP